MTVCVICGKQSEKELCPECLEKMMGITSEKDSMTAEEQKEMQAFFERNEESVKPKRRVI